MVSPHPWRHREWLSTRGGNRRHGNGTYTAADMTSGATVTTNSPIPLASDAVW
jgi:hypothetical protein